MDDRRDSRNNKRRQAPREQRPTDGDKPSDVARGRTLNDYKPGGPLSPEPQSSPHASQAGGLLSRFAGWRKPQAGDDEDSLSSADEPGRDGAPDKAGSQVGRQRAPRAGDWRASDFAPHELEHWDRNDAAPFELPEASDDTYERVILDARRQREHSRSGFSHGVDERDAADEDIEGEEDDEVDEDEDGGWEEGWDGEWANEDDWLNESPRQQPPRRTQAPDDEADDDPDDGPGGGSPARRPVRGPHPQPRRHIRRDPRSGRLDGFFRLMCAEIAASFSAEIAWLLRRFRRRPAAAATVAFLLLGFLVLACAPLATLARLGYDGADAIARVTHIQHMLAGGASQLLNPSTLKSMQGELDGLSSDLAEINAATQFVGAPLSAASSTVRNYTLLMRIGFDLTTAGDEALHVAEIILTPLQGGALSSAGPGIHPTALQHARSLVASAYGYALDALSAYNHLNPYTLPHQLRPGTKYGNLLAELPKAPGIFAELAELVDAAPALLGVGHPAYYLVIAMDSTELRPGGGFQGNYGVLELDNGKQSTTNHFSLNDTYKLDEQYAQQHTQSPTADINCPYVTPEAPNYYWWWPIRCVPTPPFSSGQQAYGWGLRDSNLSADFPTDARAAMQIAQSTGATPDDAPFQGVIAFTPGLIQAILRDTGNITIQFNGKTVVVTPDNLEFWIHEYQLGAAQKSAQGRKQFTHELAALLLARLRNLHGAALKPIIKLAFEALKTKDLQVYLADPRVESLLQQLGLASTMATGNGDGYFVVDTNVGGNKANAYVTEQQTDLVTLLPNGGALHRLEITVTYNKTGSIYSPLSRDYNDVQRVYLPGDATILGWSGYNPTYLSTGSCPSNERFASIITDCSQAHGIFNVSTSSDTPGRTMVLGALTLLCGNPPFVGNLTDQQAENAQCDTNPQPHTANIFLAWYTPHAYTTDSHGHIHYSELIEKQAGGNTNLNVYLTTAANASTMSNAVITDTAIFAALLQGAKKLYSHSLDTNTIVAYTS